MVSRALVVAFVMLAAQACYGYGRYDVPVGEVEVTSAPFASIQAGPTVIYAGRPHYWDGRNWFYYERGRWFTYDIEPRDLRVFRQRYLKSP